MTAVDRVRITLRWRLPSEGPRDACLTERFLLIWLTTS